MVHETRRSGCVEVVMVHVLCVVLEVGRPFTRASIVLVCRDVAGWIVLWRQWESAWPGVCVCVCVCVCVERVGMVVRQGP